ncbi:MAG: hypothetical protein RSD47_05365 [Romboutsia sp.]
MAINLGRSNNTINALNLQKHDVLDLTKKNPGLEKVILGVGWVVASICLDFDIDI